MGRFLTKDTWNGNSNNPMSFNAWNYVDGNPINFSDPSGFMPLACTEDQDKTYNNRYCRLYRGGYIDIVHFRGKKERANWLISSELPRHFGQRYGEVTWFESLGKRVPIRHYGTYLTALPLKRFRGDELGRIALGMIMDFEYGFETEQGIDPSCRLGQTFHHCSSFSNEDLPSDYLGVISEIKPVPLATIVGLLGGGEQASSLPNAYWGRPGEAYRCSLGLCSVDTPFNYQCTFKVYNPATRQYYNIPWPSYLVIQPYGFGVYWGKSIGDFRVASQNS